MHVSPPLVLSFYWSMLVEQGIDRQSALFDVSIFVDKGQKEVLLRIVCTRACVVN